MTLQIDCHKTKHVDESLFVNIFQLLDTEDDLM